MFLNINGTAKVERPVNSYVGHLLYFMAEHTGYNTNLAAEFHVLSVLHRLGLSASLTLANRKAIDIVVESRGRLFTIDVKGMASRTNWPMDNFKSPTVANHFIALVTFNNKIGDPAVAPNVFLVPAEKISRYFYRNPKGNRQTVRYSTMRDEGHRYLEAWDQLQ